MLGVDCPGCGLTRSVLALLKGNVLQSIALHPMGVLVLLWLAGAWWRRFELSEAGRKIISCGVLAGFLIPWIVKLTID